MVLNILNDIVSRLLASLNIQLTYMLLLIKVVHLTSGNSWKQTKIAVISIKGIRDCKIRLVSRVSTCAKHFGGYYLLALST